MPANAKEDGRSSESQVEAISTSVHDPSGKNVDLLYRAKEAAKAIETEHRMSTLASIKAYRKAVGWSVLLSLTVVMEGFDVSLMSSLFAFPPFQEVFGFRQPDGSYELTAPWQTGLSNGARVGQIIGLFLNGIVAERYGYRRTLQVSLAAVIAFIFIVFFAKSIEQLLVGQILLGIPWGVFQTLPISYAAEVCPTHLRHILTSYVNICWALGKLISAGLMRGMLTRTDEWGYRIPFALQWMWPVPIMIGIAFAPESPWWLVRKGRIEDAKRSLARLSSHDPDLDQAIALMVHTNEMEKSVAEGTSYLSCFRGTDLRRTEITCCAWIVQTLCGFSLVPYSQYFYRQAGLSTESAFGLSIGNPGIAVAAVMCSWYLMRKFGRRTLYLVGLSCVICLELIIGCVSLAPRQSDATSWAIGSMLLTMSLSYNLTIGPACYALVGEIPSTRLKTKTIALARNFYLIVDIVSNILIPRMLNPTAWDWGATSGFYWAGSSVICITWVFFRLPEANGRTYHELDVLFESGVPARKFKSTYVDPLASCELLFANSSSGGDDKVHLQSK